LPPRTENTFFIKVFQPVQAGLENKGIDTIFLDDIGPPEIDFGILSGTFCDFADIRPVPESFLAGGFIAVAHIVARPAAADAPLTGLRAALIGRRGSLNDRVRQPAHAGPGLKIGRLPAGDIFFLGDHTGPNQGLGVVHFDAACAQYRDGFQVLRSPYRPEPSLTGPVSSIMDQAAMAGLVFPCGSDAKDRRLLGCPAKLRFRLAIFF
jgi:hypothetical protein